MNDNAVDGAAGRGAAAAKWIAEAKAKKEQNEAAAKIQNATTTTPKLGAFAKFKSGMSKEIGAGMKFIKDKCPLPAPIRNFMATVDKYVDVDKFVDKYVRQKKLYNPGAVGLRVVAAIGAIAAFSLAKVAAVVGSAVGGLVGGLLIAAGGTVKTLTDKHDKAGQSTVDLGCKIAGYGFALGSQLSQAAGALAGVAFGEKAGKIVADVSEGCDAVLSSVASVGGGAFAGIVGGVVVGACITVAMNPGAVLGGVAESLGST